MILLIFYFLLNRYKDYCNKDMSYSRLFELEILLFIINMVNLLNYYVIKNSILSNTEIHRLLFLIQIIEEGGRKITN